MLLTKSGKKLREIGSTLLRTASWPLRWIVKFFTNEWEVTIWIDPQKKTQYQFKWLEVCKPTHLKGRLTSGEPFELNTQEAFNFQIKKVK